MTETVEIDREALQAWLEESEVRIAHLSDPTHHTFLPLYQRRADVQHMLEAAPAVVVGELVKAARCYAAHGEMYLERWPHSRVRPRRMAPLELALISREADVMEAISASMGVDVLPLLADMCDDVLQSEVRAVTGGTLLDTPAGPGAALGSLALLYWAALGALVSEDADGFDAARLKARALLDEFTLPDAGPAGRMRAAHAALAALKPLDPPGFANAWCAHLEASQKESPGALDRAAIALGCAAQSAGCDVSSVDTGTLQDARYVAYLAACVGSGE